MIRWREKQTPPQIRSGKSVADIALELVHALAAHKLNRDHPPALLFSSH